ncbi:hypothetical protein SLEP1_g27850 [Rubroshorea leprosula]|uniref:F-box associated beta-propeller type 1 domain-containing protein n=1 Tax=Rubroshorea leprosula TaxID=152421 RepID=A0AAV5JRP9_9ROSI|nr:hypothetical protein SLEP1_g27850 [Rubroshorea leprosula]
MHCLRLSKYLLQCSGLGYDSALDDYKIVLISEFSDSRRDHVSFQVWVFGLKSNSWQKNQDAPLVTDDRISFEGVFTNGALHWECDGYILGFDLANEVFFKLPGNLYTSRITAKGRAVEFYIFVSDNGGQGAGGSWKKAFALEAEEIIGNAEVCFPWPLACSKGRDSILLYKSDGLIWYDLENEARQRVEIGGMPWVQGRMYRYHACCASLVSLGDGSAFDGAALEEILIVGPKKKGKC